MSRYAIVINGKVDNVIETNPHSVTQIANKKGGISVFADNYPIQPGDDYRYGKFYREGNEIKNTPTETEMRNNENKQQGIDLSEREIQEIIQGQQISDLEIRLLIGGL